MTNELNSALVSILNQTIESTGSAINFVKGEIPIVIREILLYNGIKSALLWFLLSIVVPFLYYRFIFPLVSKEMKKPYLEQNNLVLILGSVLGSVITLGSILTFFLETVWLQILLAPRLYLIEYAAHLIK